MIIGIVHNNNNRIGGIENQIVSLVNEISNANRIIYFTQFPESVVCHQFNSDNIKIVHLKGGLIRELRIISSEINKEKIDVLQIHTFDEGVKYRLVKFISPQVKIVIRVHTYIACSWIPRWKKRLYYLIDGFLSPLVNQYILNGNYMIAEMKDNTFICSKKMISVIDGTKELASNPIINFENDDLVKPHLLMIANIIPHKGHNILIEAIGSLMRKGVKVDCSMLGATDRDSIYFNQIKKLAIKEDVSEQIHFIGFNTDIKKYIKSHKFIVLPSDSEGTPNCIMEGMSMKRCVIVSDTGGVSEFVENGKTGFLHLPKDPNNLVETLQKVFSLKTSELDIIATNGYEFWRNNLSITAMAQKFMHIYNNL